jgi:hypothetical protein
MLSRQMHTAEPLVSEPSSLEVEIAIKKLEWYKSPDIEKKFGPTDSSWR